MSTEKWEQDKDDKDGSTEKRQGGFAETVNRRVLVGKWNPPTRPHGLWTQAAASLTKEKSLNQSLILLAQEGNPEDVITVVNKKLAESKQKRLRFRKKDGTEIVISEVLEKIAANIHAFNAVVDAAVQFDPGLSPSEVVQRRRRC